MVDCAAQTEGAVASNDAFDEGLDNMRNEEQSRDMPYTSAKDAHKGLHTHTFDY